MTKYFVDGRGNYLGGFDGAKPPEGSIEISAPPSHAADKWDGNAWALDMEARKRKPSVEDIVAVLSDAQKAALDKRLA